MRQTVPAKVNTFLDSYPALRRLGVGVSGGPDSVALLRALATLAPRRELYLTVLHVNHALRPEADREQRFVEFLCQRWQIPYAGEKLTPPRTRKGSEAWARTERYRFFRSAREHYQLHAVALAHTRDDQAETVLFRLLRGSGRRGVAGIAPIRDGWLLRPLLDCSRQEVMAYLAQLQLPYVTDPSNADLSYARNKIRHVLLPFLQREFSPHIRRRLASLAATFRIEEDWLESLAAAARERVQEGPAVIALERLEAEPAALRPRILRQWLEQTGNVAELGFDHFERLRALSERRLPGPIQLPGAVAIRREGKRLWLESKQHQPIRVWYSYVLAPGQEVRIPEAGWRITMTMPIAWDGPPVRARSTDRWQAIFDMTCLPDTLEIRNFQPGDRIRPLGMTGHKKVHDVFVDAKVPRVQRSLLPLLVHGGEVVWVPGYVRGEAARVTSATRWVCQVTANPLPEK